MDFYSIIDDSLLCAVVMSNNNTDKNRFTFWDALERREYESLPSIYNNTVH